ncbi:MAG: hypothetical protein PHH26_00395 [Candidatus Thermoplasmatota archaeon]|nr:hypothetical protein [Candidatus Thermoplasmatota archaeon]
MEGETANQGTGQAAPVAAAENPQGVTECLQNVTPVQQAEQQKPDKYKQACGLMNEHTKLACAHSNLAYVAMSLMLAFALNLAQGSRIASFIGGNVLIFVAVGLGFAYMVLKIRSNRKDAEVVKKLEELLKSNLN